MSERQKTDMVQAGQEAKEESGTSKKSGGKKWGIIGGIAVILIAFIIGISICNSPSNRLSRQLDLGNRYLEEQNYEQAVIAFDQAIALDPMSVEAYLGKAQAYEGMGDIGMAMQTLEEGYEQTGDERLLEEMQRLDPVIEWEDAAMEALMREYLGKFEGDIRESEVSDIDMTQILDPVIEWEDAAFEALIREYLGKPEGDIRVSDVSDIERIVIYGIYIEMPDERIEHQSWNSVSHYSFESDKREIKAETVWGNIETLNDIRHFRAIEYLQVGFNNISDISGLSNLTNLKDLHLFGNDISDISALSNLTNLANISLNYNNISDISALSNLINLTELYMADNNISDISALRGLTNLNTLNIEINPITDYSSVSFVEQVIY